MRKNKWKNLQPWLDYFELLHTYEQKGFLEMKPDKHEAYITRAALYTLADTRQETATDMVSEGRALAPNLFNVVRRIRAYAAWCSQQGASYTSWAFAIHIVHEDMPHDLLDTILLTQRRRWWWLWRKTEHVELIEYGNDIPQNA